MKGAFLLVLLVLIVLLGIWMFPFFGILPKSDKTKAQVIDSLLIQQGELARFSAGEMIYKVVFPHQFISTKYSMEDLALKIKHLDKGLDVSLSLEDKEMLSLYNIMVQAGLNPLRKNDFLILELKLVAGWELTEEENSWENIVQYSQQEDSVFMQIPELKIIQRQWLDQDPRTYKYPDVPVSPQDLRVIIKWINEHLDLSEEEAELLDRSKENNAQYWTAFFKGLGVQKVIFP